MTLPTFASTLARTHTDSTPLPPFNTQAGKQHPPPPFNTQAGKQQGLLITVNVVATTEDSDEKASHLDECQALHPTILPHVIPPTHTHTHYTQPSFPMLYPPPTHTHITPNHPSPCYTPPHTHTHITPNHPSPCYTPPHTHTHITPNHPSPCYTPPHTHTHITPNHPSPAIPPPHTHTYYTQPSFPIWHGLPTPLKNTCTPASTVLGGYGICW